MAAKTRISMITGYDFPLAQLEERAGIDIILVGDSLGMTVLGYDSTLPVGMDIMIEHCQAVRRGAPGAFLVGDMPFMSYQTGPRDAVVNAGRFMKEAGTDAVKLEGGRNVQDIVAALTKATIPVMGHLGLTPQSIAMLGGFKAQGRSLAAAEALIEDAKALEEAGAVMILLEAVPPELAQLISERATIPIIGIGAGPFVHGQLLIVHDMLGFFDAFTPKFVKKYANLNATIADALAAYIQDIESGAFPQPEHNYKMEAEALAQFKERYQAAV
jgi:3-methyl-2-oxobutanoate hydroxymethyltransferase